MLGSVPWKIQFPIKTCQKTPVSISKITTKAAPGNHTELVECHWRYFFSKSSKSTRVGLGGMARIGTLLEVSIGIIGKSDSNGRHQVFCCLSFFSGGENWTDTLLFSFNLHSCSIRPGLRPIVPDRVPRRGLLRLDAAKCLTSIVRHICLSRSMRTVVAMSVESNRPAIQPDVSNHLPFFPFRSTLRIS